MKLIAKGDRKVLDIYSTFYKTDATLEEIEKAGVTKFSMYHKNFLPFSSQWNMKMYMYNIHMKYVYMYVLCMICKRLYEWYE